MQDNFNDFTKMMNEFKSEIKDIPKKEKEQKLYKWLYY